MCGSVLRCTPVHVVAGAASGGLLGVLLGGGSHAGCCQSILKDAAGRKRTAPGTPARASEEQVTQRALPGLDSLCGVRVGCVCTYSAVVCSGYTRCVCVCQHAI